LKRIVLFALALLVGFALGAVVAVQYARYQARAYELRAIAAIEQADSQIGPVQRALDAVPTHFTNTVYFVNTSTPQQEVAPLVRDLEDARASLATAEASLSGHADSAAVSSYLRGLEYLDAACVSYIAYSQTAAEAGQWFFDSAGQSETSSGMSGYSAQDSLRNELKSNPDRLDGAYAILYADEALAEARKRAEKSEK